MQVEWLSPASLLSLSTTQKMGKDIGKHTNTHYIQQEYTQALVYNTTQSSLSLYFPSFPLSVLYIPFF